MASVTVAQRTSQWRGCLGGWSLEAASEQSIIAQPYDARGESVGGSAPAQLLNVAEKPGVSLERRQFLEEERQLAPLAEHTRWKVRNQVRRHTEFFADTLRIADDLRLAVHLNHPVATDALRQILVRCPDAYFLHPFIFGGEARGRGEGIVGFQLTHGPHDHAHRGECIFERMKLREQCRFDAVTRLVARPKSITEGFDDVIGRHAEMGRPLFDHLQHGMQHAVYSAAGSIVAFAEAAQRSEEH